MLKEQPTSGSPEPRRFDSLESEEVLRRLDLLRTDVKQLRQMVLEIAVLFGRTQPIPSVEMVEKELRRQERVTNELVNEAHSQGFAVKPEIKVTICPPGIAEGAGVPDHVRVPVGRAHYEAPLRATKNTERHHRSKTCVECRRLFIPNSGVQRYCRHEPCPSAGCPEGVPMQVHLRRRQVTKKFQSSLS